GGAEPTRSRARGRLIASAAGSGEARQLGPSPLRSDGGWRTTGHQPHDQSNDKDDQEDKEQHLRDAGCRRRHTAEAEETGNHRDDQKNQSPMKHSLLRRRVARTTESGFAGVSSSLTGSLQ